MNTVLQALVLVELDDDLTAALGPEPTFEDLAAAMAVQTLRFERTTAYYTEQVADR